MINSSIVSYVRAPREAYDMNDTIIEFILLGDYLILNILKNNQIVFVVSLAVNLLKT